MRVIIVYITMSSKDEAQKIARHLLEKRLIACANLFPITSMYWWENAINEGSEYVLIAKTSEVLYENVKCEVEKLHSFSIPCIMRVSVEVNKKYEEWLRQQL